jgi:hypothetical protein
VLSQDEIIRRLKPLRLTVVAGDCDLAYCTVLRLSRGETVQRKSIIAISRNGQTVEFYGHQPTFKIYTKEAFELEIDRLLTRGGFALAANQGRYVTFPEIDFYNAFVDHLHTRHVPLADFLIKVITV